MDMGRVVPAGREGGRVAVEDDAAANKHEPVDVLLDSSELVGAKEDRHTEVPVELLEESGKCLLSVHVDAGGRLVEDEQIRAGNQGFRQESTLLLSAGEPAQDRPGPAREADPLDRLVDEHPITATEGSQKPPRHASALDDFANGRWRIDAELSPLCQVPDSRSPGSVDRRLAEEKRLASPRLLEPDGDAKERRLTTTVRAGDSDELAGLDLERDVVQDLGPTGVGEADVTQLDRYRHPSAARREARFDRISEK
jgi:hypothetical protein